MNTLLFGNGINIQFGGRENLNKEIIIRAVKNIQKDNIPKEVLIDEPDLLLSFFGRVFKEVEGILNGEHDMLPLTRNQRISLEDFKNNYKKKRSLNITEIGFEDYFLVLELLYLKNNIQNPEAFIIRETFKRFFIHSIYNNGKVNEIYKNYPENLKIFLDRFDKLFTTNYDRNVEHFTNNEVHYLHGAFHIKDDVYNENSLRNYLSDRPLNEIRIDENFPHLYSNALTTYNGNNKLFVINQGKHANRSLEKLVAAYSIQEGASKLIDRWAGVDNPLVRKLHESIKLKDRNPELAFSESYPIAEFNNLRGNITIIGLAPNNDTHIFSLINNNENIKTVTYYYYTNEENNRVKEMLKNKYIKFKDVKNLWAEVSE